MKLNNKMIICITALAISIAFNIKHEINTRENDKVNKLVWAMVEEKDLEIKELNLKYDILLLEYSELDHNATQLLNGVNKFMGTFN